MYHHHLGLALAKNNEPQPSRAALLHPIALVSNASWAEGARRVMAGLPPPETK